MTATVIGGGLQVQFIGTPNYPYILETATNLATPINWQPVLTNPADAGGNWSFTVTNTQDVPARFYRAAEEPAADELAKPIEKFKDAAIIASCVPQGMDIRNYGMVFPRNRRCGNKMRLSLAVLITTMFQRAYGATRNLSNANGNVALYPADKCIFQRKLKITNTCAIYFMHCNFRRVYQSLRVTPTMEVGD